MSRVGTKNNSPSSGATAAAGKLSRLVRRRESKRDRLMGERAASLSGKGSSSLSVLTAGDRTRSGKYRQAATASGTTDSSDNDDSSTYGQVGYMPVQVSQDSMSEIVYVLRT